MYKKRHTAEAYNSILGIPQTSTVTILGLTFQPNCKFSTHLKEKLCKTNKCLYVIRCLQKEGCSQAEVDHLFSSIVLPNITYALSVYGASESELTIAQQFLDRCFKRRYISKKLEIGELKCKIIGFVTRFLVSRTTLLELTSLRLRLQDTT